MVKIKTRIITTILSLFMSMSALALGVYAVTSQHREVSVNGTINFSFSNAKFEVTLYKGYGSGTYNTDDWWMNDNHGLNFEDGIVFEEVLEEDGGHLKFEHPSDTGNLLLNDININEVQNIFAYKIEFKSLEDSSLIKIDFEFDKPEQGWIDSFSYNNSIDEGSDSSGTAYLKPKYMLDGENQSTKTLGYIYVVDKESEYMQEGGIAISARFNVSKVTEEEVVYVDQIIDELNDPNYSYAYEKIDGKDGYRFNAVFPGYNGISLKDWIFRDEMNGLPVLEINGFSANSRVSSVDFPKALEKMNNIKLGSYMGSSEKYLSEIKEIDFPKNLENMSNFSIRGVIGKLRFPIGITDISSNAFPNGWITEVIIPEETTQLSYAVFARNNLKNIIIPNSVQDIGTSAFSNNKLKSITLHNNITNIGGWSFHSNKLEEIILPENATIGSAAFVKNKLKTLVIPSGVTMPIDSPYTGGDGPFASNDLTQVTISEGVTIIPHAAFRNNSLTEIIIPDSVTSIYLGAFDNNQLTSVKIGSGVTIIDDYVFSYGGIETLITVTIDSEILLNKITSNSSQGNLIQYAQTIYVKDTLSLHANLVGVNSGKFTLQGTSDKDNYKMYFKNL